MTIRIAAHDDLEVLVKLLGVLFAIEADFIPDTERQQAGLQRIMESGPGKVIYVAEVASAVVGMCVAQETLSTAEGREAVWIEDVVVSPAFRRRGIAHALLRSIEEWAHDRGVNRLQLLADRDNAPALLFYSAEEWNCTQLICLRKRI